MSKNKWKLLAIILAALAVLILASRLATLWHGERSVRAAAETFEAEVWPLDLWSHALNDVEGPRNAAHWAEAGAGALTFTAEEGQALQRASRLEMTDWSAGDRRVLAEAVTTNAPALELLHRAAPLEDSTFDLDYGAGHRMPIPNLAEVLRGGRLLLVELRLALLDERPDDAVLAARSLRSLTRACQRESPLIFQLIGFALERLFWDGVQELVLRGAADADLAREFRQPLLESDVATQFRRSVGAEAALLRSPEVEPYLLKDHYDAAALDYYAAAALSYPRSPAAMPGKLRRHPIVFDVYQMVYKFQAAEALRDLAQVALGIYLDGLRTGTYPADLSAFPEAASNVYTGEPLDYQRDPGGSAVVSVPGAVELWQEQNPNRRDRHPRFSWRLPAPPGPPGP